LRLGANDFSGIEITLNDPSTTDEIKRRIEEIFGDGYLVQDKYEQNRSLYSIMNVERWVIYGVLCLILVVACIQHDWCINDAGT
jgi:lipoprotein-releasing system permease protein